MAVPDSPGDDLIGVTIADRYRIISQLGVGGMGVAYRAWDSIAQVPVVIKIPKRAFLDDPRFAERFVREIRVLQGLSHPNIVPILDMGEHEGLPFVVMRFLPGGSLSNRRLRDETGRPKATPPGMLTLWLRGVASALDHIHAHGIVHRDVKPGNIFFDGFWSPFLGDFGIAKIVEESDTFDREHTLTATGMLIGTHDYMAPEQFTPKAMIDGRADQYALAVVVYEVLAGFRPFLGESSHLIVEVMTQPAPRLDGRVGGLPSTMVEAVHRGLDKRADKRFPSCSAFADAVLRDVPALSDDPDVARLLCPQCASILKLPTSAAGQEGKCPKCRTTMKVAEDLGALWLLDEARRQRQEFAASVEFDAGRGVGGGTTGVEGKSRETFRTVSTGTRSTIATPRRRHPLPAWIDSHGLTVGGVLLVLALVPWLLLAGLSGDDRERKSLAVQLGNATRRVESLSDDLEAAQNLEQDLRRQLAALTPTIPPEPAPPEAAASAALTPALPTPAPAPSSPASAIVPFDAAQARKHQEAWAEHLGIWVKVTNSIGQTLVVIPPGKFTMGEGDKTVDVTLTKPFLLGQTEVTNAQWNRVMGSGTTQRKDDDRPVEQVSWEDAMEFCRRLSALPAEREARREYRLPTEAEWEYACRAGTNTTWSFGDDASRLGDYAWYDDNSQGQPDTVGKKKPNAWDLFDMHGNVLEWCSDWFGEYGSGALTDPQGPSRSSGRVVRGGYCGNTAWSCRSAGRGIRGRLSPSSPDPSIRASRVGFRLALSLSADQPTPPKAEVSAASTPAPPTPSPAPLSPAPAIVPFDAAQARKHQEAWAEHLGIEVKVTNSIGQTLVVIPPGKFTMGEGGETVDVTLTKPFLLGQTEVTNAQWNNVMGSGSSQWKGDERPVDFRSWEDAMEFCRRLSALPAERAARREYRLPTEAEWEYACRAGTNTIWSFGDDESRLGDYAWWFRNSWDQAHAVGKKKPNAWDLFDMYGNVSEWCSDWHAEYGSGAVTDPQGPSGASKRVARGGTYAAGVPSCRSARRHGSDPSIRASRVGFRLALSLSADQPTPPKAEVSPASTPAPPTPSPAPSSPAPAIVPFDAAQARKHQEAWAQHLRIEVKVTNSIGQTLVVIPPGKFTMGEGGETVDVTLTKPFLLGQTEITKAQWIRVMGSGTSQWKGDDLPVDYRSWEDAVEFCRRLSALPAEREARREYRLPTEAEWEYACRAGTNTTWSFGDDESRLGDYAWSVQNSLRQTQAVASKKPNAWDLFDMHGNVREWCSDWYDKDYYAKSPASDPKGPSVAGSFRVIRGGSWDSYPVFCRSATRSYVPPSSRHSAIGFRVVCELE
jgi:formylglycine-generating enzyme required for sulfatase activity/serine/threonine protein kinase